MIALLWLWLSAGSFEPLPIMLEYRSSLLTGCHASVNSESKK
jgi:hypothetical protein